MLHTVFIEKSGQIKKIILFLGSVQNHFHGHNYELIVHVTGSVDPETGYVIDMKVLKNLIKSEVEDKMDHKNLNEEVPEFIEMIPTAENIAIVIFNNLKPHLNPNHSLEVTLYETPRNFVRYSG